MSTVPEGPEELDSAAIALPGERRVLVAAQRSLNGETRGLRAVLPFLGPAFVASVAYVDPGNFATNVAAGAQYGYLLLWVVLVANLMAMLIQALSAKLGIATGRNLAQLCGDRFPRGLNFVLWIQAELIAMATDLAEFVGATLGLNLLVGIPLLPAAVIVAIAVFAILSLQSHGFRSFEVVVTALVGVIVLAFTFEVFLARPSVAGIAGGLLVPRFADSQSLLLAVGIVGATVMPHVIYLHSALTQRRVVGSDGEERRKIFNFERWDVIIAMSVAGVINLAMLAMAASVFHVPGLSDTSDIGNAYRTLGRVVGRPAELLFGLGLLASGLSASSVGTLAGQVVMQGFLGWRIPLFLRRSITMAPALVVVAIGFDPSRALVLSQVFLSFGIPFALIPLVFFCADRTLMGTLVSRRSTTLVAMVVAAVITVLNGFLIYKAVNP